MNASSESGLWAQTISVTALGVIEAGSDKGLSQYTRQLPGASCGHWGMSRDQALLGPSSSMGGNPFEIAHESLEGFVKLAEQLVNAGHIPPTAFLLQCKRIVVDV